MHEGLKAQESPYRCKVPIPCTTRLDLSYCTEEYHSVGTAVAVSTDDAVTVT